MRILITPFVLLWALALPAQEAADFRLHHDEDGVRVYLREEANGDISVRVETEAEATVAAARRVLDEVDDYPYWVHRCSRATVLPGGTERTFVYQSIVDLPFPFRDREVVARIEQQTSADGRRFTRHITSVPDEIPATAGVERMRVYEADWVVEALEKGGAAGAGSIVLRCTVRTDAGGGLPGWLRREVVTGGPAKTMVNLRDRLGS